MTTDSGIGEQGLEAAFLDAPRLRRLHSLVQACASDPSPHLKLIHPAHPVEPRQLAVLSGSFNPTTDAHVALAQAAELHELGPVVFLLSTHTIDKEQPDGALLEDRLLVLELHAERRPGRLVALANRGLYVEQAQLFRDRMASLEELIFIVGFDKIVQIFDSRYYADRDKSLEKLVSLASFAVAGRGSAGRTDLEALLERSENVRFAERVKYLDLPSDLSQISSSAAREALAAGEPVPAGVPPETVAFVNATGCYRPAGAALSIHGGVKVTRKAPYAERVRLLVGS